jgi:CRP/FNR family cyclic AMP-dependent transcriptional regulator
MPKRTPAPRQTPTPDWTTIPAQPVACPAGSTIFAQGDPASSVMYLQEGLVRLSVLSHAGKEVVIAMIERGQFFGEGCLAGQSQRISTATAMTPCRILTVERHEMTRRLHADPAFADHFLTHLLTRNIRIEEDLVDQLLNPTEKRLARALLLLSHYGQPTTHRDLPKVSQEVLAEMVGTTRSRVNHFMNKFRALGFIEYQGELKGEIKVHSSLLHVVLSD